MAIQCRPQLGQTDSRTVSCDKSHSLATPRRIYVRSSGNSFTSRGSLQEWRHKERPPDAQIQSYMTATAGSGWPPMNAAIAPS